MKTDRTPQERMRFRSIAFLLVLGAAAVAVVSLAARVRPNRGQQKSADRAFAEVIEGDSRARVEALLGKPAEVDIWPTPRPPVVTNKNGSITVSSHIGPPPWEKWHYPRGGETFVIQFGPETWEGRDRWRVTGKAVGEQQDDS